jgi:RNA polymerase sigma-70 factor (ECF subfamily)
MRTEAALIARCRRGEATAWDELFDQHYAATGRFVCQLFPEISREDAEEICQQVFLSVVRNLRSFNGKSRLQTWIFRIAVNQARDFREKQHAAKRGGGTTTLSLDAEDAQTGLTLDPPCPSFSPDQSLMRSENLALVGRALAELGGACREVIELRYFGELTYEEIAVALHLNRKTVGSRLCKGLERLEFILRRMTAQEKSPAMTISSI